MEIINVIMFTCCAVNRVLYLWLTFANLQVIPCMVSNNNNKKSQKCSAKKWWYPLCLIIQHFAEILVAVMRRLIYFPTVTALKPNCPQVSWLSPTQLSCCPFEKWTDITRTNFKRFVFFFFPGNRQNDYQAVSGVFTKLAGILCWIGPLLLLYHKISDYSGFLSHLCITTLWLLPIFSACCLHT